MVLPDGPNQRWSLDFVSDSLICGRRFRILCVVDDYTRECLALVADTSLSGVRVARELTSLMGSRGKPHTVVSDNLFHSYITPPAGLECEGQSIEGRLHDVFSVLLAAIRSSKAATDYLELDVLFLMAPGRHERVRIIAVVGPGDHGEPVMTIMLPGDD